MKSRGSHLPTEILYLPSTFLRRPNKVGRWFIEGSKMFEYTADYRILSELGSPNGDILGDRFFEWMSKPQALASRIPAVGPGMIAAARRELEGLWFRLPELAALYNLPSEDSDIVAMTVASEALIKKLSLRDFVCTFAVMTHYARINVFLGDLELLNVKGASFGVLGGVFNTFRGAPTMREQVGEYGRSMLKRRTRRSSKRLEEAQRTLHQLQMFPLDALASVLQIPIESLGQALANESTCTGVASSDIITSVVVAVPPLWSFLEQING